MTPHGPPVPPPATASPTSPAGDTDRTAWFSAFLATSTDEARQLQWFPAPATLDPKAAAERAAGQAADRACETVRLALIAAARDVDGPGAFWREVAGAILDAPPDAVGHRLAEQLRLTVRAGNAAAQQRYGHRRAVVPDPGDPTDPAWWRTEAAQKVLFARLWRGDALAGPLTRLAEPYRRALAADPELVLVLLSAAQPAPLRLAVHTALVPVMAAAPVAAASARPSPRRRGR